MKKSFSCEALQSSIDAAPDMLRHCCKRFFVNGEMRGDVKIFNVNSDEDISYEKILDSKKNLIKEINAGNETACSGCPWLRKDNWPAIETLKINHISIETHSICNLKCTYCSDVYYGGKKASYDVRKLCRDLDKKGALSKNISFVWGGGEPVLLKNFNEIFTEITNTYSPTHNNIFTNATIYNTTIEKFLRDKKATITTSIDAGTIKTFKKIRGANKFITVLNNLKKYHEVGGNRVTIKYIFLPGNISITEIKAFLKRVNEFGLQECSFQISSDFKREAINDELTKSALFLFEELKKMGTKLINFDDHLRPRINANNNILITNTANKVACSDNIVIWGAGAYAYRMLEESEFFKNKKIKYFVDTNAEKHGQTINGLEIKTPDTILNETDISIFIASAISYREIYETLLSMKIPEAWILDANII